jgi:hypothetical protein
LEGLASVGNLGKRLNSFGFCALYRRMKVVCESSFVFKFN